MTIRNRDAQCPSNLSLDTLQAHQIAAYRSGEWLAPPKVTSAKLRGHNPKTNDAELLAELSARLLVATEVELKEERL